MSIGKHVLAFGRPKLPDLFVIDVRMPGLSGLDLRRELVAAGSGAPVIFITAYEDPQGRTAAMAAGATAFLQKPFDNEILLGAIRAALSRKDSEGPSSE